MKIAVTGSLGHISKPLTQGLVQMGHSVTVVSHNTERQKEIENLGAVAAIGSVHDAGFVASVFAGKDAVYTMLPPGNYMDKNFDIAKEVETVMSNYAGAIEKAGIKRVVHLSSIGAHLDKGNGLLAYHHKAEQILGKLSQDVSITFMRPTGFYYNLYGYVEMIKKQGIIAANYGGDDKTIWVSPIDIAAAVAEEFNSTPLSSRKIQYVASEELTCSETARILGEAIGKPELKWIVIPDEQMKNGLIAAGMKPEIAAGMVEMYSGSHMGLLAEDYYNNRPAVLGKVKMKDFAKEFTAVFNKI